jgi:nucleoside-diphosphate-sugar epimerase
MALSPPEPDFSDFRLAPGVRSRLRDDGRRIVVVGARGWIGRSALALLYEALGRELFAERVACFGSNAGSVDLENGFTAPQRPLAELGGLEPKPTLLLHLAFLTKDKVAGMNPDAYAAANRALSRQVLDALAPIGADRVFVASSGAAAFADDPGAADDLKLYGALKREDESLFADWAEAQPERRRAAIARIYSVSGPYINKHQAYALANFILDALAGRPIEVRAPMRVLRSYVAVRELLSLALALLLADDGSAATRFDTGGEALELGVVAQAVADALGGTVVRRPISEAGENRYVGDDEAWREMLSRHRVPHLALQDQIRETAAYLARAAGGGG